MRKMLITIGIALTVLIATLCTSIGLLGWTGRRLDADSKVYAESAVRAIAARWDAHEVETRAAPELVSVIDKERLDKLMAQCRRLGRLRECQSPEGQARVLLSSKRGKMVTAEYAVSIHCDAGAARVRLTLIKRGNEWKMLSFYVDSDGFLEETATAPAQRRTWDSRTPETR